MTTPTCTTPLTMDPVHLSEGDSTVTTITEVDTSVATDFASMTLNITDTQQTADSQQMNSVPVNDEVQAEEALQCFEQLMNQSHFQLNDVRVALIGNVDSGKSTLVGVLSNALLDDGRGLARSLVLRHRHEQENGRTSAPTVDVLGFHSDNRQVLPQSQHFHNNTNGNTSNINKHHHDQRLHLVGQCSDHSVTLIDLCGHEKYLKTTLFGLTGLLPDFALVVVGSNMGVQVMTREHISIAAALHLPLIIVVTKCDLCPPNIMKATKMALARLLRAHRKMPFPVKDDEAVAVAAQSLHAMQQQSTTTVEGIAPVFTVSSVTGESIDLLRSLLSQLRRSPARYSPAPAQCITASDADDDLSTKPEVEPGPEVLCLLDGVFDVKGVGLVLGGTLAKGSVHNQDTLFLGPDKTGGFIAVSIKSIESRRAVIEEAIAGQSATFAIRPVNRKIVFKKSHFRKGMVLVSGCGGIAPKAAREFEAHVVILHHSTTVAAGYQPVIHCGVCRQSAQIVSIADADSLCTGEKSLVCFRFVYQPEYLLPGTTFIFREGKAKGIGKIVRTFPATPLF